MSIPGTIGAFVIERPADVEEGFSQSAPLVLHYGHTSPAKNLTLYNLLVSRMADIINMKCDESKKGKISSPGPEIIKLFSCSTQLSLKFFSS